MENIPRIYTELIRDLQSIAKESSALDEQQRKTVEISRQAQNDIKEQYARKRKKLEEDLGTAQAYLDAALMYTGGQAPKASPQKPDFAQMQRLYVCIESPRNPEVNQLLCLSAGAVLYLKNELSSLAAEEENAVRSAAGGASDSTIEKRRKQIDRKYRDFLNSPKMKLLARATKEANLPFFIDKKCTYDLQVPSASNELMAFGVLPRPFPVPAALEPKLQELFGVYYDAKCKQIRLPLSLSNNEAVKMTIAIPDSMQDRLQRILRGMLFNILRNSKPLPGRVVYIDPNTFNPEHLGLMKHFAGQDQMIIFPTSRNEISSALDQLLELSKSSAERETRYLIVKGYPNNLSSDNLEKIRNILYNCREFGIRVILTGHISHFERLDQREASALVNAQNFKADDQSFYLCSGTKKSACSFYTAPNFITSDMGLRINKAYSEIAEKSRIKPASVYDELIPFRMPVKQQKKIKDLVITYGSCNGQTVSFSMGGITFAAYLLGSSRSGKSTLIHTIIANLTSRYHPDDLELWLADLGNSALKRYAKHPYPHIRYLVLDDAVETNFAFIGKLYSELERRRKILAHYDAEKHSDLPPECNLPAMLTIVDEFGPLSSALADLDYPQSRNYRDKLDVLLMQGAKHGMFFIFANQNYNAGVQGLTDQAKNQIALRLIMYAPHDERFACAKINDTSDDTQAEWLRRLEPHQLIVSRMGALSEPAKVLYLDEEALQRHDTYADRMQKELEYVGKNLLTVTPDSVEWESRVADMIADVDQQKKRRGWRKSAMFLYPGSPRSLEKASAIRLLDEESENVLLLCPTDVDDAHYRAAASVLRACIRSAVLQNMEVTVLSVKSDLLCGDDPQYHHIHDAAAALSFLEDMYQKTEFALSTPHLVVIPDADKLIAALKKYQERGGRKVSADDDYARLVKEYGFGSSPESMEGASKFMAKMQTQMAVPASTKSTVDYLGELLRTGPENNLHFLVHCRDAEKCKPSSLEFSKYHHRLLFRRGAGEEIDFRNATRYLSQDEIFVYELSGKTRLYTPFITEEEEEHETWEF